MKVLDLFSGIGGFSLGLEAAGMETVAFCEINPFRREVLKKNWPDVPIYEDVRELNYDGSVDVICGGFPCQDISWAGKREGIDGSESKLWFEFARLIRKHRPKYAVIENAGRLKSNGLARVLRSIAEIGYDAEWNCIPASYVGSPQERDRCWIVAYPMQSREARRRPGWVSGRISSAKEIRRNGRDGNAEKNVQFWPEPTLARVANGVPGSVDRINALGDTIVPQIAEHIGRAIMMEELHAA